MSENQKTPMTDDDRRAAKALGGATYVPASYDKRFAHAMYTLSSEPDAQITDKQRKLIWLKVVRYRRQIPKDLVNMAIKKIPDLP